MSDIFGSFLKIGCWNVNSLGDKSNDHIFVETIKGYDILCLQETKVDPDDIVYFENYQCHVIHRAYKS